MHSPISIVIINHNNKPLQDVVNRCILQISENDEIIIVNDDTNNMDDVQLLVRKYSQIICLNATEKQHNRGHNRNIGIKAAKNEIVLMLDGDILIDSNALNLILDSFENENIVAVTGFTHLISYTSEQLELLGFSQTKDYFELITPHNSMVHPYLLDYRSNYGDEKLNSDNNWFYFFSCFMAIHKRRLQANTLFLEDLNGWGAEDIEFAYQLSLSGKLYFNRKINNVHIPHARDHVKNLINNHKNLYILLKKHPTLDFEILLAFASPRESINRVKDMINSIIPQVKAHVFKNCRKDCLYTTIYSFTNSNIFIYGNEIKKYSLLGIALPISTQSIDAAYIDGAIMNYPVSIVSLILREHLRIAQKVYIVGEFRKISLSNNNDYFKSHIVKHIDFVHTEDLRMFQFVCTQDGLQVNSSLPKYEIDLEK